MSESLDFQRNRSKYPYRVYKLVVSCFLEFAKMGHYRKLFRALTGLDTFSRESLAIYMDKSIKGEQVCDELGKIKAARGLPQRIKVDNGTEFISRRGTPERTSTRSHSIAPVLADRRTIRILKRLRQRPG